MTRARQQPQQLRALEPDRHTLGIVFIIVRREGLLFGQHSDLPFQRRHTLGRRSTLGRHSHRRVGLLLHRHHDLPCFDTRASGTRP